LFEPRARVMHLGSTSLKSPLKVEFWKGVGLARYFRKRADNIARLALAVALTPLIIGVSVIRPVLRGQALKKRGGLRY
jgi:N-acetylglucosaminyl-diphospho-decaprenol L-rhamnosyltransferase